MSPPCKKPALKKRAELVCSALNVAVPKEQLHGRSSQEPRLLLGISVAERLMQAYCCKLLLCVTALVLASSAPKHAIGGITAAIIGMVALGTGLPRTATNVRSRSDPLAQTRKMTHAIK